MQSWSELPTLSNLAQKIYGNQETITQIITSWVQETYGHRWEKATSVILQFAKNATIKVLNNTAERVENYNRPTDSFQFSIDVESAKRIRTKMFNLFTENDWETVEKAIHAYLQHRAFLEETESDKAWICPFAKKATSSEKRYIAHK